MIEPVYFTGQIGLMISKVNKKYPLAKYYLYHIKVLKFLICYKYVWQILMSLASKLGGII